jgi:hypothetical protein
MIRSEKFGKFWVVASGTPMPESCWGSYGRVGVLELESEDSEPPLMLSDHPKRVVRVVQTWEDLFIGKTSRCAFEKAWELACDLASSMAGELVG